MQWSLAAVEAEFGEAQVLKAQEAFRAIDTDNSGRVDITELEQLMHSLTVRGP